MQLRRTEPVVVSFDQKYTKSLIWPLHSKQNLKMGVCLLECDIIVGELSSGRGYGHNVTYTVTERVAFLFLPESKRLSQCALAGMTNPSMTSSCYLALVSVLPRIFRHLLADTNSTVAVRLTRPLSAYDLGLAIEDAPRAYTKFIAAGDMKATMKKTRCILVCWCSKLNENSWENLAVSKKRKWASYHDVDRSTLINKFWSFTSTTRM